MTHNIEEFHQLGPSPDDWRCYICYFSRDADGHVTCISWMLIY